MADVLEDWFINNGWQVIRQPVSKPNICNIYAQRLPYKKGSSPALILCSHIDTVPPYFPVKEEGGILYGRGACDTKSIIAAQLLAAQEYIREGKTDLGMLYVVNEETDHSGMKLANELQLNPRHLIVGEPTQSKIIKMQKGIVKFKLTSHGIAAHSGYPHTGKSAIEPLLEVLHDLKTFKWPISPELGDTTMNIGIINGGVASNIVPNHAEAIILFRVIGKASEIINKIKEIVNDRVTIDIQTANDAIILNTIEGFPTDVVCFNTDIPYFNFTGKAYLYGPGSILDAHTSREQIVIADLKESVHTYVKILNILSEMK